MLRLGVLLLLQVQLVLGNRTVAPSSLFKGTSLEQLITRAFNARVADGTWASIYGSYDDLIEQPYCSGFVDDWLLPEVTGDLQRVLEKGVFTCGYSQNVNYEVAGSPENGILIRAGETPDTLTGMHVDWWESLIEYAGEAIDTPMQLEWKLYPSSQDAFTALYEGEIDAMCAQWAGDGTWMVPGLEESYVRGVYFDVFTCPPFLQRKFVYTNVSLGTFPTIESLADPIIDGRITDVCVTGTPGGGFEQSCENTIQLYTNETVRCTGYGADAFAEFLDGKCQAVWDGVPPPATFSRYNAIELPYLYVPVYYFRQKDLPKSDPPKSSKTTLELAVTLAYERVIEKGVWDKLIGSVAGIETAGFCFGDSRNWPQPAVVDGTDLAAVVNRGTFICGATDNYEWYSADGTLIGRWFGADNITGRGPELWKSVMKELSIVTGSEIALEYKLYESTDEVFEALYNGEIDSACGDYLPSGAWTHTVVESEVARPLAFSAMQCPELMSSTYLFTEGGGPISSLPSLFEAIGNSTESFPICVANEVTGALVPQCQSYFDSEVGEGKVNCFGAAIGTPDINLWATENLGTLCSAVWMGFVADLESYNFIETPIRTVASSFFRISDLDRSTSAPSSSPDSSHAAVVSSSFASVLLLWYAVAWL